MLQVDLPHPEQWTRTFGVSGRPEIATDVGQYIKSELLPNGVLGNGEVEADFAVLEIPYVQAALRHHFFPEKDFDTRSTQTVFVHIEVTLPRPSEWTVACGPEDRAVIAVDVREYIAQNLATAGEFVDGVEAEITLRDTPFVRKVLSWEMWPDGIFGRVVPEVFATYTRKRLTADLAERTAAATGSPPTSQQVAELVTLADNALRREIRDVDPFMRWHPNKGVLSAADEPEKSDTEAVRRLYEDVLQRYTMLVHTGLVDRS
ncbi:hypothetical protein ACWEDZ_01965 [Streptomyces sp. NPDC005047]